MSVPSDRHVVIDAIRQTLRCDHCRAEALLPPQPATITDFSKGIDAFTAPHRACLPTPVPTPAYVRTAPGGAAMKRDERGLWWDWTPQPGRTGNQLPTYNVQPLIQVDAWAALNHLVSRFRKSENRDDQESVKQAFAAMETEGVAL